MAANREDPRRSWRKPGVLGIPEGVAVERLLGELVHGNFISQNLDLLWKAAETQGRF